MEKNQPKPKHDRAAPATKNSRTLRPGAILSAQVC